MSTTSNGAPRYFIVAGEASGDRHGASLMAAMRERDPTIQFAGIGGARMQAQGMESLYHAEDLALVGFWEVLKRAPFILRVLRRTSQMVRSWRPTRVILIDYPGFNLRLARRAQRGGIPVTYYVSPQLWAWKEGRIATIRRYVDQLLVIFPFEVDWYRQRGVQAQFVGHPILEEPQPDISREAYLSGLGLDPASPVLTLFPGSRQQELERHVVLGLASGLNPNRLPARLLEGTVVTAGRPRLALRYADAAIVASGTSTVEGAVWGVPMVVVYRVAPFSWWLGQRLIKLPYVGMVNILAGEEVVPEFLQKRALPAPLAESALRYFKDRPHREAVLVRLAQLRHSLVTPSDQNNSGEGASQVAARAIMERL